MNDLLEIILYVAAAVTICGLRCLSRNLHRGDERDGFRKWFLHGGKTSDSVRRWLLPGGHTHDAGTPEAKGGEAQQPHAAQKTRRGPRKTWTLPEEAGKPTHSRFEPPVTTPATPMYKGRPARLWWLPEQAIPKGRHDPMLGTAGESSRCRRCTESNPTGSTFCGQCGSSLPAWNASAFKNGTLVG
jgi:hypothetical protein